MDCSHAFQRVNLTDWARKCQLCTKRTRFPWKKLLKCKTCRMIFHVKCATNEPQIPNMESLVTNDSCPESKAPVFDDQSQKSDEPAKETTGPEHVEQCFMELMVATCGQIEGLTIAVGPNLTPSMTKANSSKSEVSMMIDSCPESEAPVLNDQSQKSNEPATETTGPELVVPCCTDPVVATCGHIEGSTIAIGPNPTPSLNKVNSSKSEVPLTIDDRCPESKAPVFYDQIKKSDEPAKETTYPEPVVSCCTELMVDTCGHIEGSTIAIDPNPTPSMTKENSSKSEVPVTMDHCPESEVPILDDQSRVLALTLLQPEDRLGD